MSAYSQALAYFQTDVDEEPDYDAERHLALLAETKLVLYALNAYGEPVKIRDEVNHALWEISTAVLADIKRKKEHSRNGMTKAPATAHSSTISDEQLDDYADRNRQRLAETQLLMDGINAYGEKAGKFRDEVRHELLEAATAVLADVKRQKERKW
jgi:hypothetical protein